MQIANKRAFVTGAASGIGKETALALARAGANVLATDVDADGLAGLQAQADRDALRLRAARLDVTDRAAYEALAAELKAQDRLPHIVVNNAGVAHLATVLETAPEIWERLLRINVMGVVNGCQVFGPWMARVLGQCSIVNISSGVSAAPMPNLGAYAATKCAVEGLTEALALELAQTGIHVMSVHPGVINTPIVHDARGIGPSMTAEHVAALQKHYAENGCHPRVVGEAIVAAIGQRRAKLFVGPAAKLAAFARRFLPNGMKRRLTLANAVKIGFWRPDANAVRSDHAGARLADARSA